MNPEWTFLTPSKSEPSLGLTVTAVIFTHLRLRVKKVIPTYDELAMG